MSRARRETGSEQIVSPDLPQVADGEPVLGKQDPERETLHDCLRKLVQLMPQVSRGLRRRQVPPVVVSKAGLGPRHGATLSLLREQGPMSVGCLAAELGLTLGTVSGIVADIERVGFIERAPDPADRRRTIVTLACGQREAVGTWLEGASAPLERALDKLSPEERATFVKAMTLLEAELNTNCNEHPS
jgi:DNA-binding MarR family transcriptional regulator